MTGLADIHLSNGSVEAAIIAAAGSIVLAVFRSLVSYASDRRERERKLYSEAYRDAMAWHEMLYRVRRRAKGDEADRVLIERFHTLQESIDFHQGWISGESTWMGRSYRRLVKQIKSETKDAIISAWSEPHRRLPAEGTKPDDYSPKIEGACARFLTDVRWHLSAWWLPKLAVVGRNGKPKE